MSVNNLHIRKTKARSIDWGSGEMVVFLWHVVINGEMMAE